MKYVLLIILFLAQAVFINSMANIRWMDDLLQSGHAYYDENGRYTMIEVK